MHIPRVKVRRITQHLVEIQKLDFKAQKVPKLKDF